jgi:hypothetical protein
MIYVSHCESLPPPPRFEPFVHKPFSRGKTVRDYPSSAQASTFPFRSFFLTYRILYAKALYPYQFSVTADLSSEVRPASSFIQRAKLTLRFAKGKVKTIAPSITLCFCLQLNLSPFLSPTRVDVLRLGISQAGCDYEDVRMLIIVQLREVELTSERLESYSLPAGPLRAVNPIASFSFRTVWRI